MSFFDELKRRNVFRVAVAYAIAAWVLLQVADLVLENIDAPSWVIQALMLVVLLGFVAAVVVAWAYELTPEGIKKEIEVDRSQSIVGQTGKKLDRIIIGFLALAVIMLLVERSLLPRESPGTVIATEDVSAETSHAPQTTDPVIAAQAEPSANSIAVLPFANRSMQQGDLFFTDGIHDDLLTQLAKVNDLKVISRTSMMKYRDTEKTIPEIAAELGVSTILEGGIQRAGKRIRINAQLIDVGNDQHIWAETFDREMTMENIFDIQSEITRQIVTAVRGELTETESATLAQVPTRNLEAYEAYLQALALTNRADYEQDNFIRAEIWLNKAIELDPGYVQAWVMMVEVHGQAAWMGYDSSPERMQAARRALDQAVKMAPGLSETLAAEGEYLYRIENNYRASVEKYQAAILKAPANTWIMERLAVAQRRLGLFDTAINNFYRALELDPGNSRSATLLVDTLMAVGRFEEAVPLINEWMVRFPEAMDLRAYRIQAFYEGSGDLPSARELLNTLVPWAGGEYAIQTVFVSLLERDYQAVINSFEIAEVDFYMGNRGWIGWDQWYKGFAHRQLGDEEAAQSEFKACIEAINSLEPTGTQVDGFEQEYLARCYAGAGMFEEGIEAADRAEEIMFRGGDQMFGALSLESGALVLGMAGRRDEAMAVLERLQALPNAKPRWWLHLDPEWDFFRDDERFNELARPLNLDEVAK